MKEMKDLSKPVLAKVNNSVGSGERWKRDKLEMMTQLDKSRNKANDAERELVKLRNQVNFFFFFLNLPKTPRERMGHLLQSPEAA